MTVEAGVMGFFAERGYAKTYFKSLGSKCLALNFLKEINYKNEKM